MKQTKTNAGNTAQNMNELPGITERAEQEAAVDASKPINRGPVDIETSETRVVLR
jgi:hypothetical protein